MTRRLGVGRRRFLAWALGAVTALVLPSGVRSAATFRTRDRMLGMLWSDLDAVRGLGMRVLAEWPDAPTHAESALDALWSALPASARWSGLWIRQSVRESANLRMRNDFAEGRTLVVSGWVISETEAALAAAVAERSESA